MIVTVLVWIGIAIALLILGLIAIPIKILARGFIDDRDGLDYLLVIDWGFGLFSIRAESDKPAGLYFAGFRVARIPLKTGKNKKSRKKPEKRKPSPSTWLGWIRNNLSLMKHILHSFVRASFLQGHLKGKIGLADPADTAFVSLLCRWIQIQTKRFHVSVTTAYDDEMIHIEAKVQCTLIIGYLGLIALRLLLKKQIRVMLGGFPRTQEKEVLS